MNINTNINIILGMEQRQNYKNGKKKTVAVGHCNRWGLKMLIILWDTSSLLEGKNNMRHVLCLILLLFQKQCFFRMVRPRHSIFPRGFFPPQGTNPTFFGIFGILFILAPASSCVFWLIVYHIPKGVSNQKLCTTACRYCRGVKSSII